MGDMIHGRRGSTNQHSEYTNNHDNNHDDDDRPLHTFVQHDLDACICDILHQPQSHTRLDGYGFISVSDSNCWVSVRDSRLPVVLLSPIVIGIGIAFYRLDLVLTSTDCGLCSRGRTSTRSDVPGPSVTPNSALSMHNGPWLATLALWTVYAYVS
jgi:hypothetical protein